MEETLVDQELSSIVQNLQSPQVVEEEVTKKKIRQLYKVREGILFR